MGRSETLFTGAAIGMALLEAASAHARPATSAGMRVSTSNTPAPSGDMYQTGRGLLAVGDVTGAMAAFRQALLDSPQSVDALNGLGVCYDRLGRYDISRGYYDSALVIEPNSPLVLNNLGYSLYLQGQYSAAIPVLQRAAEARDPAVVAASQRVLAMVAAQMREGSARNSTREALAEIAAPRARIEVASNGEQRLVLGAPAPDKILLAALGDDAALVTIVRPAAAVDARTRRERIAPQFSAAPATIAIAGTDADAPTTSAGELPTVVYLSSSTGTSARTLTVEMPAPAEATGADSVRQSRVPAIAIASASGMMVRVTPATVRAVANATMPRLGNRQRPIEPRKNDPAPTILPVATEADPLNRRISPAWLLSSRQSDLLPLGRGPADRRRDDIETVAAFDSDLDELNRFAARMRGQPATRRADPDVERDETVAKLEALIARIRAA